MLRPRVLGLGFAAIAVVLCVSSGVVSAGLYNWSSKPPFPSGVLGFWDSSGTNSACSSVSYPATPLFTPTTGADSEGIEAQVAATSSCLAGHAFRDTSVGITDASFSDTWGTGTFAAQANFTGGWYLTTTITCPAGQTAFTGVASAALGTNLSVYDVTSKTLVASGAQSLVVNLNASSCGGSASSIITSKAFIEAITANLTQGAAYHVDARFDLSVEAFISLNGRSGDTVTATAYLGTKPASAASINFLGIF